MLVGRPDGIDMTDLSTITRNKILPKYTKPAKKAPVPFNKHAPLSNAPKATREQAPSWFNKPDSGLELCARAVCHRFQQLCFFECLSVAKRLSDGDQSRICEKLRSHPQDSSVQLPYEVDEETRENCAELVQ